MEQGVRQKAHNNFPNYPLAELHAHLGASISPLVLWQIAHDLGIKLPREEYNEFRKYIMLSSSRRMKLDTYFEKIYHPVLDRLSSGTLAVQQATYHTFVGAYRANNIQLMELRCNPIKHNLDAELDLDHITLAMLRGMEQALLECPRLSAGLIFCMGREMSFQQNALIVEKAIKFSRRGIVGIDVAGPATAGFQLKDYTALFHEARTAGLKLTIHSGEVAEATDIWEALEYAKPERLGHGIRAAYDVSLMKELAKRKVVLEICPMSNVATRAVENIEELRFILRSFIEHNVLFCLNTDWPEVITRCHLRDQFRLLHNEHILSDTELRTCNRTAFAASFTPAASGLQAYL
jgi:adenosine deaminase